MSAYFDADMLGYSKEIIELGTEIFHGCDDTYYQGQAIHLIARTYTATGKPQKAAEWVKKVHSIVHVREALDVEISTNVNDCLADFHFFNYWYLKHLYYMAAKISRCVENTEAKKLLNAVMTMHKAADCLVSMDKDMQERLECLYKRIERIDNSF